MDFKVVSHSELDTMELAQNIESEKFPNMVICLDGELGSGKTVFTKAFAQAMEYVDTNKQERLRKTSEIYLSEFPSKLKSRFDVIEIYAPNGIETENVVIHHLENAFE